MAAFVAIVGTPTLASAIESYRHGWYFMIVAALVGSLLMLAARLAPVPEPSALSEAVPAAA